MTIRIGWEGRYFEELSVGDVYRHALGRTVSTTDNAWFTSAHAEYCAGALRQPTTPAGPLVSSTHTHALVIGQSVTDVSRNVFANLGWDDVRPPALRGRDRLFDV